MFFYWEKMVGVGRKLGMLDLLGIVFLYKFKDLILLGNEGKVNSYKDIEKG